MEDFNNFFVERNRWLMLDLVARYKGIPDDELRRLHLESLFDDLDRETSDRRFQSREVGDAAEGIALRREASRRYKRSAWIWSRLA